MTKKRRKQPLFSMEELCKMNGIEYDTSNSSDSAIVELSNGECVKIDTSFNLFDKRYLPISASVSYKNETDSAWVVPVTYSDHSMIRYTTKKYKKMDDISKNVDYSYTKKSPKSPRNICPKTNLSNFTAA